MFKISKNAPVYWIPHDHQRTRYGQLILLLLLLVFCVLFGIYVAMHKLTEVEKTGKGSGSLARHVKNKNISFYISSVAENLQRVAPEIMKEGFEIQGGDNVDPVTFQRRNKVRKMMLHAWNNYVLYAWGKNELRPISKQGYSSSAFGTATQLGATIIGSLDTLYVMKLMREFQAGRQWIETSLITNIANSNASVSEMIHTIIGSLLSCYSMTGDAMFREKALEVGFQLLGAFNTDSNIPLRTLNEASPRSVRSTCCSILSEFGAIHLELEYLSQVTGVDVFRKKALLILRTLKNMKKLEGLYPSVFDPRTGQGNHLVSVGYKGGSFYAYLLKSWLQSGKHKKQVRYMFQNATMHIIDRMIRISDDGKYMYFSDIKNGKVVQKMDHSACSLGGLFALASVTLTNNMSKIYLNIAERITRTCHQSYTQTPTKLGPPVMRFSGGIEAKGFPNDPKSYTLRPELVESYFVLYRTTGKKKYRDWAWEVVEALEKYCRVDNGYSGITNVYSNKPFKTDVQRSYFLSATLKYLYLLYSDNTLLPLDEWVFNKRGHPLLVLRANKSHIYKYINYPYSQNF